MNGDQNPRFTPERDPNRRDGPETAEGPNPPIRGTGPGSPDAGTTRNPAAAPSGPPLGDAMGDRAMGGAAPRTGTPTNPARPIQWPGGPIPPPEPIDPDLDPPPKAAVAARDRIMVPLISAFLGAGLALAAVAGLGVFSEEPATTTTTTTTRAAEQVAETVVPPGAGATALQLREANVDAVQVGEVVIPSIVSVQVGRESQVEFREVGSGSGVVFDPDGHIITNDHVASGGSAYRVVFADGRVYEADLVGTDPVTDLAVLKIDANDLTPIELGSSDDLSVGDPTVAVGNPLGLDGGPSLTVGVLSAFNRQVQTGASDILYGMLQTDAPITQGSSGGALVDEKGRLIGITTAVGVSAIGVEGIGFATPVEIVERVVDELIDRGEAGTAYLGIIGGTAFDTASDGAEIPVGVEVGAVEPDGAAAVAGLEVGDLIVSFEDQQVQTMQDLIVLLRRSYVGDSVEVIIERAGEPEAVELVLGEK